MTRASDAKDDVWTIARLIGWTTDYFATHDIDSPRMTAEILLAYSLAISRIDLYLHYDKPLNARELSDFKSLIKRRLNREPVAYITGTKGFWNFELDVSPEVLIPRPDTECLVEKALEVIPFSTVGESMTILDLGVGSGAILMALASERPGHRFFGVDLSFEAARVTRENQKRLLLDEQVAIICCNWLDVFKPGTLFDVIVSNPPYIPSHDIETLEPEVSCHEPRLALDGDENGLSSLGHIIKAAPAFLKPGGYLFLEMGFDQKEAVCDLIGTIKDYEQIEFFKDYAGNDRVAKAMKIR